MMKLAIAMVAFSFSVQAATIAVIDSGLDTKHQQLQGNIWTNLKEIEDGRDNDGNGYQDDVHGWNFAEQNGMLIDYKYENTYTADAFKFFEVQGRMLLGKSTPEDKEWLKAARENKELIANLQKFGNFVHGTHVAGITVRDSNNEAMGIKLIPTEVKPFFYGLEKEVSNKSLSADVRMKLLKSGLDALAGQQMKLLEEIGLFVASHKADVANGSFGTGYEQAKGITGMAFKVLFFREAKPEELEEITLYFMNSMITQGQKFVGAAPNTLFVFAAGNDGSNNDKFPTSPTNIKADNVISVSATYDVQFLASFSNYGEKMVDVAAPGMLIDSTIPVDRRLQVSGTSQAAPYVANVAAQIKAMNPALKPLEIKKILIGTADLKDFLKGKVVANGIVNTNRAVLAADLSRSVGISEAITRSRSSVRDVEPSREIVNPFVQVTPMALMPMFQ
ncbi:MAG: S8 family serine peptidase [Bacteriovoracaceae bacterium]|nr:S8 family serine peptidase [Bacteriovoracaceae bacterium]